MTNAELNEAVALKLGWTHHKSDREDCWETPKDGLNATWILAHPKDYSISIEDAWEVAQKMDAPPYQIEIYGTGRPTRIIVREYGGYGPKGIIVSDITESSTPLAICKAFLEIK